MEAISVASAKSRFSELISRASSGERFVIQRRERPVAILVSPEELDRLERTSQMVARLALALGQDPELLDQIEHQEAHTAMAAFGLWKNESDVEAMALSTRAFGLGSRVAHGHHGVEPPAHPVVELHHHAPGPAGRR